MPINPKIQSNFRLHPETKEQLKTISEFEKVSEAKVIEAAINFFLDKNYPGEYIEEDGKHFIFKRRKLI